MTKLLNNPYGECSFSEIRQDGSAYVDKTGFIEKLERCGGKYPFIVRPRRFGKSLFTQTLAVYYDVSSVRDFDKNFKGTYIYEHKTLLAGSFYVLSLDFSGIASGDPVKNFVERLRAAVRIFLGKYPVKNAEFVLTKAYDAPAVLFSDFISAVYTELGKKLYVIIDEYDQFINGFFSCDQDRFKEIVRAEGFIRDFYSSLKEATKTAVSRVFITGATSVSVDSVTSGFDIAKNLSFEPEFASMFGFTEDELANLIPQLVDLKKYGHSLSEVMSRMNELYNGYRFCKESSDTVFNSSMCLYYLNNIHLRGQEPANVLGPALFSDLPKIDGIFSHGQKELVLQIVNDAVMVRPIAFGEIAEAINLNNFNKFNRKDLLSSLMYMGFLTYAEDGRSLKVPNQFVSRLFFEYNLRYLC